VVTDDFGNAIRCPIQLSNFKEGPKFYVGLQTGPEMQVNKQMIDIFQIAQWVRDLNPLVEKNKTFEKTKNPKIKKGREGFGSYK